MKVGILTFTNGTNLGQRLQNYALQTALENMGFEAYTITQKSDSNAVRKSELRSGLKSLKSGSMSEERKRQKSFDSFNDEYIKFYPRKISLTGDNSWISNEFDAFITGSDQVWNPLSPYVGENFFLTFAKPEQRFTYAPSFSVESIDTRYRTDYVRRLNGFGSISVREDKGAEIVKELTGKNAQVVLDPTLLFTREHWDSIKKRSLLRKEDYILRVVLGKGIGDLHVPAEEHYPVINLRNDTLVNPSEFIDLVEHAKLIETDSYHVTIFSILYHKPFVNFKRQGTNINMNSRFQTLYSKLGFAETLEESTESIPGIDYEKIDLRLEEERIHSREFLANTIGKLL